MNDRRAEVVEFTDLLVEHFLVRKCRAEGEARKVAELMFKLRPIVGQLDNLRLLLKTANLVEVDVHERLQTRQTHQERLKAINTKVGLVGVGLHQLEVASGRSEVWPHNPVRH